MRYAGDLRFREFLQRGNKRMEAKCIIRNLSEVEPRRGVVGHQNVTGYRLLQPGPEGTSYLSIALDDIAPGGRIDPHYHADVDTFDHAFYVISGEVSVKLGDGEERVVGEGTVIYCPSNVAHSLKNVGNTSAKVLRIGASATGEVTGRTVYPQ